MNFHEHFITLTDEQIRGKIDRLTEYQHKVFEEHRKDGLSERQALFLALSWPEDVKLAL